MRFLQFNNKDDIADMVNTCSACIGGLLPSPFGSHLCLISCTGVALNKSDSSRWQDGAQCAEERKLVSQLVCFWTIFWRQRLQGGGRRGRLIAASMGTRHWRWKQQVLRWPSLVSQEAHLLNNRRPDMKHLSGGFIISGSEKRSLRLRYNRRQEFDFSVCARGIANISVALKSTGFVFQASVWSGICWKYLLTFLQAGRGRWLGDASLCHTGGTDRYFSRK